MTSIVTTPLTDPDYKPLHPPIDGEVPDVVARWAPASQLRWFNRFRRQLNPKPSQEWARFYCSSVEHRGLCCSSCEQDYWEGFNYDLDGCCCRAINPVSAAPQPGRPGNRLPGLVLPR